MNTVHDIPLIAGGFGGGGGAGSPPPEYPDTLSSNQYAVVTLALCEGPIQGNEQGEWGVYLNGTPLRNRQTGQYNFRNVWSWNNLGYNTGNLLAPWDTLNGAVNAPGYSELSKEIDVNVRVLAGEGSAVTRTILNQDVDLVAFTISLPRLMEVDNKTGGVKPTTVQFKLQRRLVGASVWEDLSPWMPWTSMETATNTARVPSGNTATNVKLRWVVDTPQGPIDEGEPTLTVYYRQVGDPDWDVLEVVIADHTEDRKQATKVTVFEDSAIQWEFKAESEGRTVTVDAAEYSYQLPSNIITIGGKASSEYRKTYWMPLIPNSGAWDIRMLRISPDSVSGSVYNETWWSSYTEQIRARLQFPNTAIGQAKFDARSFSSPPSLGWELKMRLVKVPSNYNAQFRKYYGVWDLTFDSRSVWDDDRGVYVTCGGLQWTDNPVWCWLDLATNTRFSIGKYLAVAGMSPTDWFDLVELYLISKYCDQRVPRGAAGETEPRFTCNLYLQTAEDAYRVLNNVASIFRSMLYYGSSKMTPVCDRPNLDGSEVDLAYLYTPDNIQGEFEYESASGQQRHTVVSVAYNDPTALYARRFVTVEDKDGIDRYGIVKDDIIAVGCISWSEARRKGREILTTERLETEAVKFTVGLDHAVVKPGMVIGIHDPDEVGIEMGGRIVDSHNASGSSIITLDKEVELLAGESYTLLVMTPTLEVVSQPVVTGHGVTSTLTCTPAFNPLPVNESIWILQTNSVYPSRWRVIRVTEAGEPDDLTAEIYAIEHRHEKYQIIDTGSGPEHAHFPSYIVPRSVDTVSNITVEESLYMEYSKVQTRVVVGWSPVPGASHYYLKWRVNGGVWSANQDTVHTEWELLGAEPGDYDFRIVALSPFGKPSQEVIHSDRVFGKTAPPPAISKFDITIQGDGTRVATFSMDDPPLDYIGVRIRYSATSTTWSDMIPLHEGDLPAGVSPWEFNHVMGGTYNFSCRAVDSSGILSATAKTVTVDLPNPRIKNVLVADDPMVAGWPGSTTEVDSETGYLLSSSTSPTDNWDDIADDAWDTDGPWSPPSSPLVYTKPIQDLGAKIVFSVITNPVYTGGAGVVEVRTSQDNVTWGAWGSAMANLNARYVQVRITITGANPVLRSFPVVISANSSQRIVSDLDTSTLTGSYRIGVGDIRIPIVGAAKIDAVSVSFQGTASGWTYTVVDKATTYGPRVKLFNASGVAADAIIDANVTVY